jgi:hypothetical protein
VPESQNAIEKGPVVTSLDVLTLPGLIMGWKQIFEMSIWGNIVPGHFAKDEAQRGSLPLLGDVDFNLPSMIAKSAHPEAVEQSRFLAKVQQDSWGVADCKPGEEMTLMPVPVTLPISPCSPRVQAISGVV